MPGTIEDATRPDKCKKLILCFDGTGNAFSGHNGDTNVVKILRKLDRNHPDQFHYYQTGIGTYDINESSIHKTKLGEVKSKVSKAIDKGFGTTFDAHVIAGYRFLMRYYEDDAKIYIFGFSRGAYTAKYLARLVNKVGLLCKGNEEMVPFAYRLYSDTLKLESADRVAAQKAGKKIHKSSPPKTNGHLHDGDASEIAPLIPNDTKPCEQKHKDPALGVEFEYTPDTLKKRKEMKAFGETFCRNARTNDPSKHDNIQVFFLGIWDCVNSVKVVESSAPAPVTVAGTAKHIRHAVAVDEKRVKFKPALLAQDIRYIHKEGKKGQDIREVWFPGNHGDIGGGWPARKEAAEAAAKDLKEPKVNKKGEKVEVEVERDDALQMSDMALEWMIREVDRVGQTEPEAAVHWFEPKLNEFKGWMNQDRVKENVVKGFLHDCLSWGRGTTFFKVLMWKIMEGFFFIPRWELNDDKDKTVGWESYWFWPNRSSYRDIPRNAILHQSLIERLEGMEEYRPGNNHGTINGKQGDACLKVENNKVQGVEPFEFEKDVSRKNSAKPYKEDPWDSRHATFKLH